VHSASHRPSSSATAEDRPASYGASCRSPSAEWPWRLTRAPSQVLSAFKFRRPDVVQTSRLRQFEDQGCRSWCRSTKFFRDLRSLTPTRLAYISRSSEEEVAQRALEFMAGEEVSRVEICRVLLNPPILADGAEYWLD
jgi:hypothetical protein